MPSETRSLDFSNSRMKPWPRHGNAYRIISLHAPITAWRSGSSSKEHIDAAAGGSFFSLSIEEARKLVEKMASNQSWNEERTQTRTHKVHMLEVVDMLTAKISLLRKKLEDLGLDHLKMLNARLVCEECEEIGDMGINCPTVPQDVNFVVNSNNGFCPNQEFNAGWNKPSFSFDNRQQGGMGQNFNRSEPSLKDIVQDQLRINSEVGKKLLANDKDPGKHRQ
jgi:hypothetical protein